MSTEAAKQTAVDRGVEMMHIKQSQLPPLAMEFVRKLCSEFGMCGEVYITAFAVYAQCVEGLICTDSLYLAREEDKEWFKQKLTATAS